jgi:Putative nuclear envelope organisation protein
MHYLYFILYLKPDYMNRDNYNTATSTFWSAWSDHQIRDYLIEHGYTRSDAQVKRDELVKLANEKYAFHLSMSFR